MGWPLTPPSPQTSARGLAWPRTPQALGRPPAATGLSQKLAPRAWLLLLDTGMQPPEAVAQKPSQRPERGPEERLWQIISGFLQIRCSSLEVWRLRSCWPGRSMAQRLPCGVQGVEGRGGKARSPSDPQGSCNEESSWNKTSRVCEQVEDAHAWSSQVAAIHPVS